MAIVVLLPSVKFLADDYAPLPIIEFLLEERPPPFPSELIMLFGKPDMLCLVVWRLDKGVCCSFGFIVLLGEMAFDKGLLSSTSISSFTFDFTPKSARFRLSVISFEPAEVLGLSPWAFDL